MIFPNNFYQVMGMQLAMMFHLVIKYRTLVNLVVIMITYTTLMIQELDYLDFIKIK